MDDEATRLLRKTMPFAEALGLEALRSGRDEVVVRVAWDPGRCTAGGALHGGVLMSLADSAAALCAFLNLPEGAAGTTTVESKTNFLRSVREGHAVAASRPLHTGKRMIVVETDVRDDAGKLITKTLQTQAVL